MRDYKGTRSIKSPSRKRNSSETKPNNRYFNGEVKRLYSVLRDHYICVRINFCIVID